MNNYSLVIGWRIVIFFLRAKAGAGLSQCFAKKRPFFMHILFSLQGR